jgi:predicted small lipoprotein YifL
MKYLRHALALAALAALAACGGTARLSSPDAGRVPAYHADESQTYTPSTPPAASDTVKTTSQVMGSCG